ncbi:MAG: alpha/beta hydrolase [Thermodesulfobacteriota bacterium]|jgi:pimeloyl-ACP methyl ester carboxylesterase
MLFPPNAQPYHMPLTLVLLPGLDGTGILFEPLLDELPPDLKAYVIPLPNDSPMDYGSLVPTIASSLPTDTHFILLGESFSGPLALMVAAPRPRGLVGVILCASFIRNPTYLPSFVSHLARSWIFRMSPIFIQAKVLFAGYSSPRLRSLLARAHSSVSAEVMAQRVRALLSVDCTSELVTCPVPIAYLRGSRDRVVPKRNWRQIMTINPAVREFTIRAPHLVLQTQPRAAVRAIMAFAEEIGGLRIRNQDDPSREDSGNRISD